MKRALSLSLILGLSMGCSETPTARRARMFKERAGLPEWTIHPEKWDHEMKEAMAVYSGICFNGRYSDNTLSIDRSLVPEDEAEYLLTLYEWKSEENISITNLLDNNKRD